MKSLIYGVALSLVLFSCPKKRVEAPSQPHSIKIVASGTGAFNVSLARYKTTDSSPVVVDAKAIAQAASYTYTTTLQQSDGVTLYISSEITNSISYKIYDNDKIVAQNTGMEVLTHNSFSVSYDVL